MIEIRMTEGYMIRSYNFITRKTTTHHLGLEPAVAKSIVRHYNKISPISITYFAEEEPKRYW